MEPDHVVIRTVSRFVLAAIYLTAGILHLQSPASFMQIVPEWVPCPYQVVLATGLSEIAGAMALLTTQFRFAAGCALAAYAVCVFPANIKHAVDDIAINGQHLSWWYHGPRLAFQPVLVWWALWAGGVTAWPLSKPAE